MKIAVIGAGAMGCLFAAKLALAGNFVLLIDHDPMTVSAIQRNGIRFRDGKMLRRILVPIRKSVGKPANFDLVLVMVKAYSTKLVVEELRDRLGGRATVLTLQNGLGNMELLARAFGGRVLAGSTTEASLRLGPGKVAHTGKGSTMVGTLGRSDTKRVSDVVRVLRGAGFACIATPHVKNVLWSKAVLNSAINPVSALTRLGNGKLIGVKGLHELMLMIIKECVMVGRREGVALDIRYLSSRLSTVLRSTARNQSSMLQDILNGRRTEVRELNGVMVDLGKKHRIATPLNNLLLGLVTGLEAGYA